jgi:hypothetical protein
MQFFGCRLVQLLVAVQEPVKAYSSIHPSIHPSTISFIHSVTRDEYNMAKIQRLNFRYLQSGLLSLTFHFVCDLINNDPTSSGCRLYSVEWLDDD